jgi:hypothetical protein
MRKTSGYALALVSLAAIGLLGCNNSTAPTAGGSAASTATATNTTTPQDGGSSMATGPLRCAPSEGMLNACSGKATGDACALSGKRDGGFSLPGSCRTTLDGAGLACVPTPPGPPGFLVNACSGKAAGGACSATGPSGRTLAGTCRTERASTVVFCGRTPPAASVDACAGLAAGDSCSRPEHRDGGSKPGVCRTGPSGALACGRATFPGVEACAGLDAGAACTLGFGRKHEKDELTGSCVVPASGGAATCLAACTDVFRLRHRHHHGFGRGGGGGPWWKHGASDGGAPSP